MHLKFISWIFKFQTTKERKSLFTNYNFALLLGFFSKSYTYLCCTQNIISVKTISKLIKNQIRRKHDRKFAKLFLCEGIGWERPRDPHNRQHNDVLEDCGGSRTFAKLIMPSSIVPFQSYFED